MNKIHLSRLNEIEAELKELEEKESKLTEAYRLNRSKIEKLLHERYDLEDEQCDDTIKRADLIRKKALADKEEIAKKRAALSNESSKKVSL
tara:strand:- start:149 stop:421 length:273 start_codon:yes stop_codon:yes gene_type:complete